MSKVEYAVIISTRLEEFCADGGKIRYAPIANGDGKVEYFELLGITPEGLELPVVVPTSGNIKKIKTLEVLLEFHRKHFPNDKEITLPLYLEKSTRKTKRR